MSNLSEHTVYYCDNKLAGNNWHFSTDINENWPCFFRNHYIVLHVNYSVFCPLGPVNQPQI